MFRKCFLFLVAGFCAFEASRADTVMLKEKASVTGVILAEKHDQVVVDLGYTVLTIPRNQIVKVVKGEAIDPSHKSPVKPKEVASTDSKPRIEASTRGGFYTTPSKAAPTRPVRDLVNILG